MESILDDHTLVEGVRIAYRDTGGEGRPVILIHGTPSHSYIWRGVIPDLEANGYRVLAYDLLGYGFSERPLTADTSVAAQARILDGLFEAWDLHQADVVAHDIGGATAMLLAVNRPERFRSLTLIDTVSYDSWPSETWQAIIQNHLHEYHRMPLEDFREMMVRQLSMTVYDKERMSGETLEAYLAPLSGELGKASFFAHQVSHYDSRYTQEITEGLKRLRIPTKIMWGEKDEWQPLSYGQHLTEDIPYASLEIVPGAGHFVMEDAPETVARALTEFFGTE